MDWLSSEDLKEEKVLTTSKLTITRRGAIYLFRIDLYDRFGASFVLRSAGRIQAQSQKCGQLAGLGEQVRVCWLGKI